MPSIASHGVDIHWESAGEGSPVVLVHGFGESIEGLWRSGGWERDLVAAGHRMVAFEFRGHGASGHPYEPEAYHVDKLVDDLAAVVDAADARDACFVGFSMGSEVLMRYLLRAGSSARAAVFLAMGRVSLSPRRKATALTADALVAEDMSEIHKALQKMRRIHEERDNDLPALSALLRALCAGDRPTAEAPAQLALWILTADLHPQACLKAPHLTLGSRQLILPLHGASAAR